MTQPQFSTIKEVCFHFQRSRNWLHALKKLGLPSYGTRFKMSDVEEWARKYPQPLKSVKELKK